MENNKINFEIFSNMYTPVIKTLIFRGQELKVKSYLPIEEKLAFIETVVNCSTVTSEISPDYTQIDSTLIEVFFSLNLIEYYTNIEISTNVTQSYDVLQDLGVFDLVKSLGVPAGEIAFLQDGIKNKIKERNEYMERVHGLANVVKSMISQFDGKLVDAVNTMKDFDGDKLDNLTKMAEVATTVTNAEPEVKTTANRAGRRTTKKK